MDDLDQQPPNPIALLTAWLRSNVISILGCLGCLGVIAVMFSPVFFISHGSTSTTTCRSNLKQVAMGASMYSQDYDDRLMPAVGWMDRIDPYIKNDNVFKCPTLFESEPKAYGYAFNRVLSRRRLRNIPRVDATPLAYDSDQLIRSTFDDVASVPFPGRHHGGNNFVFVDGHAKWFNEKQIFVPLPR